MIEFPADLLAALIGFTVLSVGALAIATMPDADESVVEE